MQNAEYKCRAGNRKCCEKWCMFYIQVSQKMLTLFVQARLQGWVLHGMYYMVGKKKKSEHTRHILDDFFSDT